MNFFHHFKQFLNNFLVDSDCVIKMKQYFYAPNKKNFHFYLNVKHIFLYVCCAIIIYDMNQF